MHSSSTAAATEAGLAYSAHHPPDAPSPPPARQLTTLEFPDGNALRPLPSGLSSFSGRGRSASIPHVYGFDESRQSRFSGFATSSERHDDSAGSALAERDTGSAGGRPSGDFGLRWSPTDPRHDPSRPRALSISTADEYRTRSWLPGAPHATSREREGRYGTADSAASLPSRAPPYYPPQAGPSSTYPAEPSLPPRYPYDAYRRSSLVNAPFTNPYPPYSSPPAPPPHMPLSIPSGLPGAGTVSPPSAGPSTSTFPPSVYSPVGPPPQSSWTPPAPAPPPPPAPAPLNDDPASTSDAQNTTEPTGDVGRYGCPHCRASSFLPPSKTFFADARLTLSSQALRPPFLAPHPHALAHGREALHLSLVRSGLLSPGEFFRRLELVRDRAITERLSPPLTKNDTLIRFRFRLRSPIFADTSRSTRAARRKSVRPVARVTPRRLQPLLQQQARRARPYRLYWRKRKKTRRWGRSRLRDRLLRRATAEGRTAMQTLMKETLRGLSSARRRPRRRASRAYPPRHILSKTKDRLVRWCGPSGLVRASRPTKGSHILSLLSSQCICTSFPLHIALIRHCLLSLTPSRILSPKALSFEPSHPKYRLSRI